MASVASMRSWRRGAEWSAAMAAGRAGGGLCWLVAVQCGALLGVAEYLANWMDVFGYLLGQHRLCTFIHVCTFNPKVAPLFNKD